MAYRVQDVEHESVGFYELDASYTNYTGKVVAVLRERIAEADDTSARLLSVVEQLAAEQPQYSSVLSTMVQAVLSART